MRLSVQYYMVIFFKFKSSKNNYGFIDEKKKNHVFRTINIITEVKYFSILKNTSRCFLCDTIFNILIKPYLMAKPLALFTAQTY